MTTEAIELKPCPFDGGEAYISGSGDFLGCYSCGAMVSCETIDVSIKEWNTRPTPPLSGSVGDKQTKE